MFELQTKGIESIKFWKEGFLQEHGKGNKAVAKLLKRKEIDLQIRRLNEEK